MPRLSEDALLVEVLWRLRNVRRLEEAVSPTWEYACALPAQAVFAQLQGLGFARTASIAERFIAALSQAQLKAIASELGLKTSGTKPKLVESILAARPDLPAPDGFFVVLTDEGRALLDERMQQRENEERDARQMAIDCLRRKRVRDGLAVVRAHVAKHSIEHLMPTNPLGMRIPPSEQIADAEWILECTNEYLQALPRETAECVRYEAVLLVFGFPKDPALDGIDGGKFSKASKVAGILEYSARYVREVRDAQHHAREVDRIATVGVEFSSFPGDQGCPACQKLSGMKWPSSPLPPFPIPGCSRREGCTCTWMLIDYGDRTV